VPKLRQSGLSVSKLRGANSTSAEPPVSSAVLKAASWTFSRRSDLCLFEFESRGAGAAEIVITCATEPEAGVGRLLCKTLVERHDASAGGRDSESRRILHSRALGSSAPPGPWHDRTVPIPQCHRRWRIYFLLQPLTHRLCRHLWPAAEERHSSARGQKNSPRSGSMARASDRLAKRGLVARAPAANIAANVPLPVR
jgi:hypothetical protein